METSSAAKTEALKQRAKDFAHRCVKLAVTLPNTDFGRHVRGQLIRCSTSVASNYRAACLAQSKAAFTAKVSIVVEEADESLFWMEFLVEEKLMERRLIQPLMQEATELTAIFCASRKTASGNSNRMGPQ